jgi:hypothetical protein
MRKPVKFLATEWTFIPPGQDTLRQALRRRGMKAENQIRIPIIL